MVLPIERPQRLGGAGRKRLRRLKRAMKARRTKAMWLDCSDFAKREGYRWLQYGEGPA